MEIAYIGHSCFKIKGKTVTLIFDPYDPAKVGFKFPKLEADAICVSHNHADHSNVVGVSGTSGLDPFLVSGPGEYEVKGAHIIGFPTFHDDKNGEERGKNTIYYVEIDGFFLLHLGDLGHLPSKEVLEEIEDVDVLFIPVGGTYTLDFKGAMGVISEIEPSIVVPMHFQTESLKLSNKLDGVDKFLNEWGSEGVRNEDKLKLSSKSDLPEETQVVVLKQS